MKVIILFALFFTCLLDGLLFSDWSERGFTHERIIMDIVGFVSIIILALAVR